MIGHRTGMTAEQEEAVTRQAANAVLADARRMIEQHGWIQHRHHTSEGHCLNGAMIRAWKRTGTGTEVMRTARAILRVRLNGRVWSLEGWNDHPDRAERDVLDLLAKSSKEVSSP